ncbi:MAG: multicopper oxidase domain-containing protein [Pirellulaceae bacterium]
MSNTERRRTFLKAGSIAAASGLVGSVLRGDTAAKEGNPNSSTPNPPLPDSPLPDSDYDGFSRFKPSRGNDPDSPYYIGKTVPGFRSAAAGPAPFVAPDLEKLPWKMVNGAKEFHLTPMAIEREFLPGYKMNVYGYNGSMPGPTIEVMQGDRVRIVVTNELPEDTYVHWHGFELPVNTMEVPS